MTTEKCELCDTPDYIDEDALMDLIEGETSQGPHGCTACVWCMLDALRDHCERLERQIRALGAEPEDNRYADVDSNAVHATLRARAATKPS